jgi:hypothetical protein
VLNKGEPYAGSPFNISCEIKAQAVSVKNQVARECRVPHISKYNRIIRSARSRVR